MDVFVAVDTETVLRVFELELMRHLGGANRQLLVGVHVTIRALRRHL